MSSEQPKLTTPPSQHKSRQDDGKVQPAENIDCHDDGFELFAVLEVEGVA